MRALGVFLGLLLTFLAYDLATYLSGEQTMSQYLTLLGEQHTWLPIVSVPFWMGLGWFLHWHFWGGKKREE